MEVECIPSIFLIIVSSFRLFKFSSILLVLISPADPSSESEKNLATIVETPTTLPPSAAAAEEPEGGFLRRGSTRRSSRRRKEERMMRMRPQGGNILDELEEKVKCQCLQTLLQQNCDKNNRIYFLYTFPTVIVF